MTDVIPYEMWLNIFKQMEPNDLFEKRKVCNKFKRIIDENLKYFYLRYRKRYPDYFPKRESVSVNDIINGYTKIFIENLSHHQCSPYFVKKIQSDNFTLFQVRRILDLYLNHGIQYYSSIKFAHVEQEQLNNILDLNNNGFPIFFASRFGNHPSLNQEKLITLKKLKAMNVSDYFCGKLTFDFTQEQLERFYKKTNEEKNIPYYNIIYCIDKGM